jgi:hypothetical protein
MNDARALQSLLRIQEMDIYSVMLHLSGAFAHNLQFWDAYYFDKKILYALMGDDSGRI